MLNYNGGSGPGSPGNKGGKGKAGKKKGNKGLFSVPSFAPSRPSGAPPGFEGFAQGGDYTGVSAQKGIQYNRGKDTIPAVGAKGAGGKI